MAERKYLIVGKTKQMHSVLVCSGFQQYEQRPIRLGIQFELSERQMNFHVKKQEARGVLKIIDISNSDTQALDAMAAEPGRASNLRNLFQPKKTETPIPDPPKKRGRRRKL